MNLLLAKRTEFFQEVAKTLGTEKDSMQIVLTHFLPDRPELLSAFHQVMPIAMLIAIPYSIVPEVLQDLKTVYNVVTPTLAQLLDETFMLNLIRPVLQANQNKTFVINEIGGYFAPFLNNIHNEFGTQIAGCVEDTQNGHTRYEKARPLPYSVISVARSTLKEGEDTLVGPSCYFSADRLLRSLGVLAAPRRALVIGYGKVGRGMARCLQDVGCSTSVFDINPIRNCVAQGDGMFIPSRTEALRASGVIFGCTGTTSVAGTDFDLLLDGCFLASCSSKDVEFDLKSLNANFKKQALVPNVDRFTSNNTGKVIYLLGGGTPINFLDGAVFGPVLTLVQGELILAIKNVLTEKITGDLTEVTNNTRKQLAAKWQAIFIDPISGTFPF